MQKKILLIEDAQEFVLLVKASVQDKYEIVCSTTAKQALQLLETQKFDLIMIDIMLPDANGFEICREVRSHSKTQNLPVIFVSASAKNQDKLMAFSLGANDYITKPFDLKELKARIEANILRPHVVNESDSKATNVVYGPFELDLRSQRVFINAESKLEVNLTKTEYLILGLLIKNPDRVYSRSQILESVWGSNLSVTERTVDTHLSKLRTKLDPYGQCLESVHGFGYRLSPFKLKTAA